MPPTPLLERGDAGLFAAQDQRIQDALDADGFQMLIGNALMLLQTGYQFGGKNPSAGLDWSGLVTHVYREAAAMPLKGNAAALARQGRPVEPGQLRTGDLVFFNTLGHSYSHVGIYLGNGDFIHAPSSRGRVRVENLATRYWSERFEAARTLLE